MPNLNFAKLLLESYGQFNYRRRGEYNEQGKER